LIKIENRFKTDCMLKKETLDIIIQESSHKNKISLLLYKTKKHYHVLIQKDGFLIAEFKLHRLGQYSLIVIRISAINA